MSHKFVWNCHTSLWDMTAKLIDDGYPKLLVRASVYRIFRKHGERYRVILKAPYSTEAGQLFLDAERFKFLAIHYQEVGKLWDRYDVDDCIVIMHRCSLEREWIRHPISDGIENQKEINVWIELECGIKFMEARHCDD